MKKTESETTGYGTAFKNISQSGLRRRGASVEDAPVEMTGVEDTPDFWLDCNVFLSEIKFMEK
jgi:hypothetical protein